jgi:hypothetical protein
MNVCCILGTGNNCNTPNTKLGTSKNPIAILSKKLTILLEDFKEEIPKAISAVVATTKILLKRQENCTFCTAVNTSHKGLLAVAS